MTRTHSPALAGEWRSAHVWCVVISAANGLLARGFLNQHQLMARMNFEGPQPDSTASPDNPGLPDSRPLKWSLGIYSGTSPWKLAPDARARNPVITCHDVTDLDAGIVADPFMVSRAGTWYMFFEVLNRQDGKGAIGLATSGNGLDWDYQQIVLSEAFHLSYPWVFEWEGEFYMVPETLEPHAVRLYRANQFPHHWKHVGDLVPGRLADPTVFRHQDRWWLFACPTPDEHDALCLYSAEHLWDPFRPHLQNPIVHADARRARPAGRVLNYDETLVRLAQDCYPRYGTQVRSFDIQRLTVSEYEERERADSPIVAPPGSGWNGRCMHHVDAQRCPDGTWLAAVDGYFGSSR